jgi:integrase
MRQAVSWRLLLEGPADGIKLPPQRRLEMQALTVEQVRVFLQSALATRHGPALAVAVATRMRPSEYLGLKWQDIDWPRQTVAVVHSLRRLNRRWCFADTKRSRGRRPIKLQSWVADILHDLNMSRTTATTSNNPFPEHIDLVFKTVSGHPVNADGLAKHFRSILKAPDLPRIRLYRSAAHGRHARIGRRRVAQDGLRAVRARQRGIYIGHVRSRAPAHAGRSCHKGRGDALLERGCHL